MNQRDDLDQMLSAWLDDPYTPPAPRYLGEVLERTRHTRQRHAWASLERWLPMALVTRPAASPPLRMAWLLLIAALVVALAGAAVVGGRLLTSLVPEQGLNSVPAVAPPFGLARNGLIAYGLAGDIYVYDPATKVSTKLDQRSRLRCLPWLVPGRHTSALQSGALPGRGGHLHGGEGRRQ